MSIVNNCISSKSNHGCHYCPSNKFRKYLPLKIVNASTAQVASWYLWQNDVPIFHIRYLLQNGPKCRGPSCSFWSAAFGKHFVAQSVLVNNIIQLNKFIKTMNCSFLTKAHHTFNTLDSLSHLRFMPQYNRSEGGSGLIFSQEGGHNLMGTSESTTLNP